MVQDTPAAERRANTWKRFDFFPTKNGPRQGQTRALTFLDAGGLGKDTGRGRGRVDNVAGLPIF